MKRGALALAVIAFVLAGCGSSNKLSLPCNAKPRGALCLKLFTNAKKSEVTDVIGYLAVSGAALKGKTWRLLVITGGGSYPGPTRHGNPPRETFCRPSSTLPGCDDSLAAEYASHGDFGSALPVPFGATPTMSVCLYEEVLSGRKWRTGPAGVDCEALSALRSA
ncbi:MAG TPA: hypothetical protein VGH79_08925 [Gaiellaceae bacterium]|jgi:hypothetical protein